MEPLHPWGGRHGYRIWWPAGLEALSPAARANALDRGWWRDGQHVVTIAGERLTAAEWERRCR